MRHNFRELKIWQESMKLVKQVYLLVEKIPSEEKFGLRSQISRCAVSIPSNIAEGSAYGTSKNVARFLDISLGSSFELETQLILIADLFNLDSSDVVEKTQQIQRMISGFKKTIKE